jgi:catechol 2,3-dioxygenase-like lactoylglutathione lyase family enzyme
MAGQGQRSAQVNSATVCTFAFITLLALKLAGVIGWSWWLVTLPLWGQVVIPFVWLGLLLGGAGHRSQAYIRDPDGHLIEVGQVTGRR